MSGSNNEPTPNKDLCFDSGRAEACGAIARLMCSKKTGEVIQPVYIARSYMALYQALSLQYVSMSSACIALYVISVEATGVVCTCGCIEKTTPKK